MEVLNRETERKIKVVHLFHNALEDKAINLLFYSRHLDAVSLFIVHAIVRPIQRTLSLIHKMSEEVKRTSTLLVVLGFGSILEVADYNSCAAVFSDLRI